MIAEGEQTNTVSAVANGAAGLSDFELAALIADLAALLAARTAAAQRTVLGEHEAG